MPERQATAPPGFDEALRIVEDRMASDLGVAPVRLDNVRIGADYPRRRYRGGWRLPIAFSDGQTRRIDILLSPAFPAGFPRTALVDRPEHMQWPHLERDGVMCLLPIDAQTDRDDPASVAVHLLARSVRLIEELLSGEIVDRDFREEFLTYWFYASDGGEKVRSLIKAQGPSRAVRVWRDPEGRTTVVENDEQLERWIGNLSGIAGQRKRCRTEPAAFVWLPEPPLPSAYPATGAEVLRLAATAGENSLEIVKSLAGSTTQNALIVFGAEGRGGPGLIAVETTNAHRRHGALGGTERPLIKGFRPAPLPAAIGPQRMFSAEPVRRLETDRADPAWIHGRGKDARTERLLAASAVIVGCGSLGSSTAARLARMGVGRLDLVDPEVLTWSNVGRHELGAEHVGHNKADALADHLVRQFPHLEINAHTCDAQWLVAAHGAMLETASLIIAATGSWAADDALDRWHRAQGRSNPIVYGWLEDAALAAHAVVIGASGGCLRCGFGPTGEPLRPALRWPRGRGIHEEPACGNHFQPYGAVELGFAVDLLARTALDALLAKCIRSIDRIWLSPRPDIAAAGAEIGETLLTAAHAPGEHGGLLSSPWDAQCGECLARVSAAA